MARSGVWESGAAAEAAEGARPLAISLASSSSGVGLTRCCASEYFNAASAAAALSASKAATAEEGGKREIERDAHRGHSTAGSRDLIGDVCHFCLQRNPVCSRIVDQTLRVFHAVPGRPDDSLNSVTLG
jgi:hypothetical protein